MNLLLNFNNQRIYYHKHLEIIIKLVGRIIKLVGIIDMKSQRGKCALLNTTVYKHNCDYKYALPQFVVLKYAHSSNILRNMYFKKEFINN